MFAIPADKLQRIEDAFNRSNPEAQQHSVLLKKKKTGKNQNKIVFFPDF